MIVRLCQEKDAAFYHKPIWKSLDYKENPYIWEYGGDQLSPNTNPALSCHQIRYCTVVVNQQIKTFMTYPPHGKSIPLQNQSISQISHVTMPWL